ncbi:Zinc/iron permease [Neocallimastix californiae]|jgi:ZIP family zinc transporter|uniref:Zinc/iron permease n=1 Tax=Neocallimastix californiae TaxID=1754190 RepID=A0A1Y2BYF1_9FUNG|nr:Zinc/iron permease [Neocallimastix californiae]|eukprot:ORY39793.1 Zinc/iron permease [Neocallimastix californiae]
MEKGSYELSLLLTGIAGLASVIGALLPIFVNITDIAYLIFALSFSSGVMTYISLVEMMSEGLENFKNTKINPLFAQCFFFFIGILLCAGLDYFLNKIDKDNTSSLEMDNFLKRIKDRDNDKNDTNDISNGQSSQDSKNQISENSQCQTSIDNLIKPINSNNDNVRKLQTIDKSKVTLINILDDENENFIYKIAQDQDISSHENIESDSDSDPDPDSDSDSASFQNNNQHSDLKNIGILTALVIALHNIPEGIATFTSSFSDVNMGVMLTFAIAIHNIPEGLCISFPIYYSTGSKFKAFLWGTLASLSEFASALIEYIILILFRIEITDFTPLVYGIIYAVIAGIMVYISVFELLPTAIHYDNKGNITKWGFLLGMLVMGISLIFLDLI